MKNADNVSIVKQLLLHLFFLQYLYFEASVGSCSNSAIEMRKCYLFPGCFQPSQTKRGGDF